MSYTRGAPSDVRLTSGTRGKRRISAAVRGIMGSARGGVIGHKGESREVLVKSGGEGTSERQATRDKNRKERKKRENNKLKVTGAFFGGRFIRNHARGKEAAKKEDRPTHNRKRQETCKQSRLWKGGKTS